VYQNWCEKGEKNDQKENLLGKFLTYPKIVQ
jgi:hypothetical protein